MPLHRVFHPAGFFSPEDKKAISERLTAVYTGVGLPSFYVVVIFIPLDGDSFYVGGKPTTKFVRIVSSHLARRMVGPEHRNRTMQKLDNAFAPYVKERGLDWSHHIEEHERELWRENGLVPPLSNTEGEKIWVELDKPVPY